MPDNSSRDVARDAAIRQAVSLAVYIGMVLALNVAFAKRETLLMQWRRLARWRRKDAARVREDAEVAEFRREISSWERGGGPPPAQEGGLYASPS